MHADGKLGGLGDESVDDQMTEINSAFLKLMALEEDGNQQVDTAESAAEFDEEDENWSQSSVEQHFASVLLE